MAKRRYSRRKGSSRCKTSRRKTSRRTTSRRKTSRRKTSRRMVFKRNYSKRQRKSNLNKRKLMRGGKPRPDEIVKELEKINAELEGAKKLLKNIPEMEHDTKLLIVGEIENLNYMKKLKEAKLKEAELKEAELQQAELLQAELQQVQETPDQETIDETKLTEELTEELTREDIDIDKANLLLVTIASIESHNFKQELTPQFTQFLSYMKQTLIDIIERLTQPVPETLELTEEEIRSIENDKSVSYHKYKPELVRGIFRYVATPLAMAADRRTKDELIQATKDYLNRLDFLQGEEIEGEVRRITGYNEPLGLSNHYPHHTQLNILIKVLEDYSRSRVYNREYLEEIIKSSMPTLMEPEPEGQGQ